MALWRVEQAAEYLGIRPKTLYEWVRLGRVPYRKIGFNVRFDPGEIEAWVAGQSRAAAPAPAEDRERRASAAQKTRKKGVAASPELAELRDLASDAARALRQLERDVGTSLSYPQRQRLAQLAERLENAAKPASCPKK